MNVGREPFMALMTAMVEELRLTTSLSSSDLQFRRRLLVRVLFSTFEAFAFHLKARALEIGTSAAYEFSKGEREKLTEVREVKKPDGTTEPRVFFLKSQDNLRFALAIYGRVSRISAAPTPPAEDLSTGVEVRDRLTHPKSAAAFTVTDDEAKALGRLAEWFKEAVAWHSASEIGSINRIRNEVSKSIGKQIDELKARAPKT